MRAPAGEDLSVYNGLSTSALPPVGKSNISRIFYAMRIIMFSLGWVPIPITPVCKTEW